MSVGFIVDTVPSLRAVCCEGEPGNLQIPGVAFVKEEIEI